MGYRSEKDTGGGTVLHKTGGLHIQIWKRGRNQYEIFVQ
jgi:hypothetical protein